jgi:mannose/fructose-specific phosphotransferase system component IIA
MAWYTPFINAGTNFATSFGQGLLSGASGAGTAAANNLGSIAMGGAGIALAKKAYDDLGEIGERAYTGSQDIADLGLTQTQFQPFTVRSTTGGMFGYDPQTGAVNMNVSPQEQALQQSLFGGAQGFYNQAQMPTGQREQDVYERIRATQQPEEQRQALALEERLANQGRLGVRSNLFGGTPEQLAMSKAQGESQNQAMLMAMQQAQQEQMQQAQLGQSFMGASYMPQAQLLAAQQASQLFPQLQQRGQLSGAGLFGEASMGGLEALLGSGLGQANLMGQLGVGLLGGAIS